MSIDSLRAAQAYIQAAQNSTKNEPVANTTVGTTSPTDFASLVHDAVSQTSDTINVAETASSGIPSGDANLVEVVTAISAAEVSLEAAIAVRNRMIEAYQEIMRMPI